MKIVIGSDHGGFDLKEHLKNILIEKGYEIKDVGTFNKKACDYPDFAYLVASMTSIGQADRGIMIDSIGMASAIVANKVKGIRATACWNIFTANSSREHNNANVLCLGGQVLGNKLAEAIVNKWLTTPFAGGRHIPRVDKINLYDSK